MSFQYGLLSRRRCICAHPHGEGRQLPHEARLAPRFAGHHLNVVTVFALGSVSGIIGTTPLKAAVSWQRPFTRAALLLSCRISLLEPMQIPLATIMVMQRHTRHARGPESRRCGLVCIEPSGLHQRAAAGAELCVHLRNGVILPAACQRRSNQLRDIEYTIPSATIIIMLLLAVGSSLSC